MRDAVRAGADSVEHGADVDDETLAEMVKRGTVWVPTVDHNRYYIDAQAEYGFAPGSDVALKDYIERNLESVRRAVKAGVKIGMGSDAVYSMFGQNTRELGWLVKAGMTNAQAPGRRHDDAGGAAGHAGQAGAGRARLPRRPGRGRRRSAHQHRRPLHRREVGDEGRQGRGGPEVGAQSNAN